MVKRKELMKRLRNVAKTRGVEFTETEGANHTRVWVGEDNTTVPRHNEIDDLLAKKIMKQIGE
jgi:mRNA interferase HicA